MTPVLMTVWACAACLLGVTAWRPAAVTGQSCPAGSTCVPLPRCAEAVQALQSGAARPRHCGFVGSMPNVCCRDRGGSSPPRPNEGGGTPAEPQSTCSPPRTSEPVLPASVTCEQLPKFLADSTPADDDTAPGRVARRMCRKHQEDHCALPAKEVSAACPANGVAADILEFPHMALLGYGERDQIRYSCGGSLISPEFILTAAHCANQQIDDETQLPVRWALLGATNRTSLKAKEEDTRQLLEVVEVIVHPEFQPPAMYHDIALLRLERAARLNFEDIKPACLNTDVDADPTEQMAVATGWGATYFGDDGSETLIKVNLTVRDLNYCDIEDLDRKKVPRGLIDGQLCAGGGDASDTCQGDSGGPLQLRADPTKDLCIHRLVGVISFGPICGLGKPGIYTKVAAYVPWIESIVWPVRQDGCANVLTTPNVKKYYWAKEPVKVSIPYTGPGSVARGMCRVYHVDFCGLYDNHGTAVKPDLSLDSRCHHNRPRVHWKDYNSPEGSEPIPVTLTLRYSTDDDGLEYNRQDGCGGALIAPNAVLTAARCRALGCVQVSRVILGSPGACSERDHFKVKSVHVHPEYREGRAYADLAVILLEESVDLRLYIPNCLHTPADPPVRAGKRAKAVAWHIEGSWERVSYLRANTTLTVRSEEECRSNLLGDARLRQVLPKGLLTSQMCAGGLCDNDVYPGDSGVALTERSHMLVSHHGGGDGRFLIDRVLAVASSQTYCTSSSPAGQFLPDLFTRAASYVSWIEGVVWPDER